MLARHQRTLGRWAWVMAWVAILVGQLRTLAWYRTDHQHTHLPIVHGWVGLWDGALRRLLDWAPADVVYLTYGKLWAPTLALMTIIAWFAYRRHSRSGLELAAWWGLLGSMILATLASGVEFWGQWTARFPAPLGDLLAYATMISAILVNLTGTVVGLFWIRSEWQPRTAAWWLALAVPVSALWLLTGIGSPLLSVLAAFGLAGRRIASVPDQRLLLAQPAHGGHPVG